MNDKTMPCEEALRLLAEFLDHELQPEGEQKVARHLEVCRSCFSRAEFERRLKAQLGELKQQPVDEDFAHRIRSLLAGFAAAGDADAHIE